MIKINNLSYAYPASSDCVLKDIDLDVKNGEFVLLSGQSGSGKSTLLYCLNGLIPHLFRGNLQGSISINGLNPKDHSISDLSKIVGMVFQNPENQLFMTTLKEDIAFGCRNAGLTEEEVKRQSTLAIEALNLRPLEDTALDELSAGQKQKAAIAGAYATGTDIFLFDEPCTNLDQSSKKEFIEILKRLKKDRKTVVIAEHEFEDLESLLDNKYVLKKGSLFELQGSTEYNHVAVPHSIGIIPQDIVIRLQNVCFGYDGKPDVLTDITIDIGKSDSIAIVGENGCGKTTLFKLMTGVIKPKKGKIDILGLSNYSLDDLVGKVGILFQNPDEQLFTETIEDEIMFGLKQMHIDFDIDKELSYFGLERYRKVHPHSISKGERQRVAFISVLAMEPNIIILDEPTTGLDQSNWVKLMDMAESFRQSGKTLIFSTHNKKVIERYARRVITLDKGRVISDEVSK
jgi:energy-coupling factor transporter ATP-binding protein EcfA2